MDQISLQLVVVRLLRSQKLGRCKALLQEDRAVHVLATNTLTLESHLLGSDLSEHLEELLHPLLWSIMAVSEQLGRDGAVRDVGPGIFTAVIDHASERIVHKLLLSSLDHECISVASEGVINMDQDTTVAFEHLLHVNVVV